MVAEAGPAPAWTGAGSFPPPAPTEVEALVRSLIGMMAGSGITELDLSFGSVTVRLRGQATTTLVAPAGSLAEPVAIVEGAATPEEHVISAPMIGTFYTAASPGDPPLVEVGDPVESGQVVGIIEAMKIMNEIVADRDGIVTAVLVANAQAVEYGSPLIRLRLTGDPRP